MLNKFKVKIIISIRVFFITSIYRYGIPKSIHRYDISIRYIEIS